MTNEQKTRRERAQADPKPWLALVEGRLIGHCTTRKEAEDLLKNYKKWGYRTKVERYRMEDY